MDQLYELTKIDRWFLHKMKNIADHERLLETYNQVREAPRETLRFWICVGSISFKIFFL